MGSLGNSDLSSSGRRPPRVGGERPHCVSSARSVTSKYRITPKGDRGSKHLEPDQNEQPTDSEARAPSLILSQLTTKAFDLMLF